MNLTEEEAKNLLQFLNRVDIKGLNEVFVMAALVKKIQYILERNDENDTKSKTE